MNNEERIRETFNFINNTAVSEIEEITVEYLINRVGLLAPRFKIGDMVYDPFYGDDNRIQALEVIEINYNGESFTYACADRAMYFDQRDATRTANLPCADHTRRHLLFAEQRKPR
jgi:hypothetical protein